MSNSEAKNLKFTYGHQFEPEKFSLEEITQLCQDCQPNRNQLEQQILNRYFLKHSQQSSNHNAVSSNQKKLAMNCFLSLRAYKIIQNIDSSGKEYQLTKLGEEILKISKKGDNIHRLFAQHILTNLTGMSLLKAIEAINTRGETPTLYHLHLVATQIKH